MQRRVAWLAVLALIGLLALLLLCVVFLPRLLYPPLSRAELQDVTTAKERIELQQAQSELQNNARIPLLQGLGGLLLVAGVIATWQQVLISREGQVTERFTRAVDQLGSQAVDVRTGGIYALERIARDSAADRVTVVEVLTIYVRHHAAWPPADRATVVEVLTAFVRRHGLWPRKDADESTAISVWAAVAKLQTRAPDVHAAMTVLGRTHRRDRSIELQLNDTDLRVAYLPRADLQGAYLHRAHLEDARLRRIVLRRATLRFANLQHAWLLEADLEGADLRGADLRGAILTDAVLRGAVLRGADLRGADLRGTRLEGADLTGVHDDAETVWPTGFDADRRQEAGVVTDGATAPTVSPAADAT